MTTLTPKARRTVSLALAAQDDTAARAEWDRWAAGVPMTQTVSNIPYRIAEIALSTLTVAESALEREIDACRDDDREADLVNELVFIQTVRTHLQAEGVGS